MSLRRSALAALALSLGCAHRAAAPPPADVAAYFPLAVGNEWTYADESPAVRPDSPGVQRTVRIVARTKDGYFRDTERGELRADGGCLHDRLRRLLCGPVAQGTRWSSVVSASSTERFEIASVGEEVLTPAGRFGGCVRVRAHNRANAATDYVIETTYAPGVGPVKLETFAVVDGVVQAQVRAVLRAYRISGR
ncbi:MAG TPA: hypothetical protein VM753_10410 [Anaeromyxobacter sp.]|nr:hypothetical protein [Anaeromyxobacter sp.]